MISPFDRAGVTRRQAIRKTLVFSTAMLASRWAEFAGAQPAATDAAAQTGGMHLLAVGDFGSVNKHQSDVAQAMGAFARKLPAPPTAVLALGDNFYGRLEPERFDKHFEQMYSPQDLACPFHTILGNHDYGPGYDDKRSQGPVKAQMQLDYARANPTSRWKQPAKWYALELPSPLNPLVKAIFIDTNYFEGALTPQEKLDQQRFLAAELQKPTRAPWLWLVGHHPLFSNGQHGDGADMIQRFGPLIAEHPISFYLCGHDHTLQHLEVPDYKASFVVSGGGGAPLHDLKRGDRGYVDKTLGFNHLHVTPDRVDVQYIDAGGLCLHSFQRTRAGQVTVTTPG